MENNSKITDIKNLKYKLKREGYYWSDIFDHTNSKETFLSIHIIKTNSGAALHIHENEEIIFFLVKAPPFALMFLSCYKKFFDCL